ncbi:hypothetical protein J6590_054442 [Homalodisca vitripennis]|nr:hypothetical protein J6590_054442 [Homalodisca vitripennis]
MILLISLKSRSEGGGACIRIHYQAAFMERNKAKRIPRLVTRPKGYRDADLPFLSFYGLHDPPSGNNIT